MNSLLHKYNVARIVENPVLLLVELAVTLLQ